MKKRTKTIMKHAFIYVLFAIFFSLIAFGIDRLLDVVLNSWTKALIVVILGIFGTLLVFLMTKGRVKWT